VVSRDCQNQWVAAAMGPGALGQDTEWGGMLMPGRQRNKVPGVGAGRIFSFFFTVVGSRAILSWRVVLL